MGSEMCIRDSGPHGPGAALLRETTERMMAAVRALLEDVRAAEGTR